MDFSYLQYDEFINELIESAGNIIDTFVSENPMVFIQQSCHQDIIKNTQNLLSIMFSKHDNEINLAVDKAISIFYRHIVPPRSFPDTFIRKPPNIQKIHNKLHFIKNIYQPPQRTPEWYQFRHNCITASNAWKTFISDATRSQLIYEKCIPLDPNKFSNQSLNSPMHWGVKYEPISVLWYELTYGGIIDDFGCIPHPSLSSLAASPDGINTDPSSNHFGRMLEIKNIVNREINGIPKMEYWIQMQLQMEVCNLNECDFLETRFIEYNSKEDFDNDGTFTETKDGKLKGVFILFFDNDNNPYYEYPPLKLTKQEFDVWETQIMEKNDSLTWVTNLYWKLQEVSCVLVLRNKLWFSHAKPLIENIWKTIEHDRIHGFQHHAPKKSSKSKISSQTKLPSKCLIDIQDGNTTLNDTAIKEFTQDNSSPKVFHFSTETLNTTSISP